MERAEARLSQRQIEYNAAETLADVGFQSQTRKAEALANLREARAQLREIEIDLFRTVITAPFAGVLDRRPVEIGDFVQRGDHIATIVEIDPIVVTAMLPERDIPQLSEGMLATARLASGDEMPGAVVYVSSVADETTRTFRTEVEIANPDRAIGVGMTAEMTVPLPPVRAHLVSPSIFRLDPMGRVGVIIVENAERARFARVQLVGSSKKGAWISGLPDRVDIVIVGQELVEDGDPVTAVTQDGTVLEAGS